MLFQKTVLLSLAALAVSHPMTWPLTEAEFNVKSCIAEMLDPFFPYSYENTTVIEGHECCYNQDGIFLLAQFWDYNPSKFAIAVNGTNSTREQVDQAAYTEGIGYYGFNDILKKIWSQFTIDKSSDMPIEKSFTIHGLWSDWGPKLFEWNEFCQPDIEVDADQVNITELIGTTFGKPELLRLMETYWINTENSNVADSSDEELWTHEYNKHGTCMNTVDPQCFNGEYKDYEAPVNFWQKVVDVWETLNTYEFLSREGIVPTVDHTYKKDDILAALKNSHSDKEVYIGCTTEGALDEVWFYYHIKGSVFTGDYKPVDSVGTVSCPDNIWYIPK